MPQLALAAASFTASAAPAIAATAAKATFMTTLKSVAMNVLTNVAISAAMSVLQPQVGAAGRPFEFVIDPDGPIPFAAGRIGVAGSVVHRDTFGPDLMFYGIPAVLSGAGPITAIESVKADDYPMAFDANGGATTEPYRQEFYFRSVLGEQPAPLALSTPSGLKNGATLPGWGASHKLSGKAAFLMVMAENSKGSAFPTGEVKPLVTLRGLKVYDPRKDSTYPGGSGPQRLGDPSTWTYSANPILWALKWCLGLWEGPIGKGAPQVDFQVGGIGAKPSGIDFPAFVAAANVSDANEWTVAAYPNTDDDKSQVLDGFLQAGGCVYAQRAGKISCIQRAAPRASVVTISAADTAGPLEIDTAASRIDRINTLRPRFWSEAHRWQMTALNGEITAQAYRDEDGAARTRGLDFPFVSNARQCGQLAALQIANTREGIAGVIPLKPHMQRIRPGDAFTITEPGFVLNGVKCLCLNTDYDPATGVVRVSFVSETDAKYPFAMGQNPTPPAPPVLTPVDPTFVTPPLPEDWTIVVRPPAPGGGQLPGFDLTGIVSNSTATAIIVEYGSTAEGPWTQAYQGPPTVTSIPIDGLQPGATYFVAVQYQRDQNYSDRYVYGPYVAPALVSTDTTHLNSIPVAEITDRLQSVEAVAATAQQGVADLELVYGDTVSAAESALAAGNAANLAVLKAGEAGDAATASNVSAGIAATKATEAGNSATAANAAKVAAEAAQDTADAKATASATSAASAAASATNAETSATAASGSATTAATKAGEASTFAGQASSSKDAAAGSASSAAASAVTASTASGTAATARDAAIGARNDAQAAAATATTQASSASAAAASASISANLAASIGTRSLNKNSIFADWTAALPATWSQWSGTAGTTYAKVAGINGSPNAVKVGSAAGDPAGIVQTGNGAIGATGGEYLVMEADVRLVSGSMVGAGLYVERYNAAGSAQTGAALTYNFATEKDASGVVRGAGVVGQTYRFSKLVDARAADTAQYVVFALTRFGGFGPAAAGEIEWRRASIRAATPEEIAAGVVLPGVEAQLAITAAVAADALTRLSTVRFDVTGGAGGDPFQIWARADASGSAAGIIATELSLSNVVGGAVVTALKLVGGRAVFGAPISIVQGGRRTTLGPGFGAGSKLHLWSGPDTVAYGSETVDNGILGITDTDGFFGGKTSNGPFDSGAPSATVIGLGAGWTTVATVASKYLYATGAFLLRADWQAVLSPKAPPSEAPVYGLNWRVVSTNMSGGDLRVVSSGYVTAPVANTTVIMGQPYTLIEGHVSPRGDRKLLLQLALSGVDDVNAASASNARLRGVYYQT